MKQIDFMQEMIIDNFAGGGGASTGLELAFGRPVDIAINHDPASIQMHKKNHPYTRHYCEDVWEVNPREVTQGRPVALCWFSPDCKHFSRAKGGKPREKKIRGLAWVALRWAATVRPRVIILENVEEFMTWGPLTADGQPDINQSGRTFNSFVNALKRQGYEVQWKLLRACDYGAPTIRKRFFMIARCDGQPIVFPKPTHGEEGSGLLPYRTAAEIIDWSIPTKSIFGRKKPLAENTMRRIARGTDKFVIKSKKPFVVTCNHGGDTFRGSDIDEPIKTITAKCTDGIVMPLITKFQQNSIGQSMDKPLDTVMAGATRFGELMPYLIQYHTETGKNEVRGQSVEEPIRTIDTSPRYGLTTAFISPYYAGGYTGAGHDMNAPLPTVTAVDHNSLAAVNLCVLRNNMDGKPLGEPLPTITTSPGHFAQQVNFLAEYYSTGRPISINEPMHTVTTKDRNAFVSVRIEPIMEGAYIGHWAEIREMLNKYCGYNLKDNEIIVLRIGDIDYIITDIGLRMLSPRELYNAQGFPPDYIIDFDVDGKRYSKKEQVARCGNSVPPPFAEALARANLPELCGKKYRTMRELEADIAG